MKAIIIATVVMTCAILTTARPFLDDDWDFSLPDLSDVLSKQSDCSQYGCPANTPACSKTTKTSTDKKTLNIVVKCFDAEGEKTGEHTTNVPNPIPGAVQSGYEFYGSYSSNGGSQTINVGGNNPTIINTSTTTNTGSDSEVETFEK